MFGEAQPVAATGVDTGHGWLSRIEVIVLRSQFDRELWEGADPAHDPGLQVRARQLTCRRRRERYARRLEMLAATPPPRPAVIAAIRRHPDVRPQRALVTQLARRLRDDRPVCARGMLRLHHLLADANGPLFRPRQPDELRAALRLVTAEIDGLG